MYQRSVLVNLPKSSSLNVEFKNINFTTSVGFRRTRKPILKGVSGCFKSGELTALMGPSGAGKSSLMNILTGFQRHDVSGDITFGANEKASSWNEYKRQSCYIQQDDNLHSMFTVLEVMIMATDLKMGNCLSHDNKQAVIIGVLESLDLIRVKNNRCDRLSGGQRKRLSIALELVDNPPVMFLDEPTTGLDYSTSLQLVTLLKSLARDGRTIICTIHQPSAAIYELFDHVYVLAEGHCVYQGDSKNTVAYFASMGFVCPKYHNPADFMIEVICKEYGDHNENFVKAASSTTISWRANKALDSNPGRPPPATNGGTPPPSQPPSEDDERAMVLVSTPSEFSRFLILLRRCGTQLFRDWTVSQLKIVIHLLVGVFVGLLYTDAGNDGHKSISNVSFMMVTVVYLSYTSLMPAVLKFPQELPVLKKERFNNWYKLPTYYIASLIVNIPVQILFTAVYSASAYTLSSQPMDLHRFSMFLLVAILASLISESFGLMLGALVGPVNGTFLGAIWICAMLVMAGFLVFLNHMPVFMYYVTYASFHRFVFEALVISIYGYGRTKIDCPSTGDYEMDYCHLAEPQLLLKEMSMDQVNYWQNVGILFGKFLLFRCLAYVLLKRKLKASEK